MKKKIPGYPGYYVLDDGRIFSSSKSVFLRPGGENELQVALHKNGKTFLKSIPKLVAQAFVDKYNPSFNAVKHIDGNRRNNNCRNLQWCYQYERFTSELYNNYSYRDNLGHLKNPAYMQLIIFINNDWDYKDIQELIPATDEELDAIKNKTYVPGYLAGGKVNELYKPE